MGFVNGRKGTLRKRKKRETWETPPDLDKLDDINGAKQRRFIIGTSELLKAASAWYSHTHLSCTSVSTGVHHKWGCKMLRLRFSAVSFFLV